MGMGGRSGLLAFYMVRPTAAGIFITLPTLQISKDIPFDTFVCKKASYSYISMRIS